MGLGSLLLLVGATTGACSAAGGATFDTSGTGDSGTGNAGAGNSGTGNAGNTGGMNAGGWNQGNTGGAGAQGGSCAGTSIKGEKVPLDMFIMLDQSDSMNDGTKWPGITQAIEDFANQPQAKGMGVGLGYFGVDPNNKYAQCGQIFCFNNSQCGICGACDTSNNWCASGGDSCTAADYASPAVPIQTIPMNGTNTVETAITSSITAATSSMNANGGTMTQTSAALQGAINYAKTWETAHNTHVTVVVLATDGDPTECDLTIGDIEGIATTGKNGTPKILTFVIGATGATQANVDGIANAGGTQHAYMVSGGPQAFLQALTAIQGTALGCQYNIPQPQNGTLDYSLVNVRYTPSNGAPQDFVKVNSAADCGSSTNAWYYDNNANPTQILLCNATCNVVSADTQGQIDVVLGCETIVT